MNKNSDAFWIQDTLVWKNAIKQIRLNHNTNEFVIDLFDLPSLEVKVAPEKIPEIKDFLLDKFTAPIDPGNWRDEWNLKEAPPLPLLPPPAASSSSSSSDEVADLPLPPHIRPGRKVFVYDRCDWWLGEIVRVHTKLRVAIIQFKELESFAFDRIFAVREDLKSVNDINTWPSNQPFLWLPKGKQIRLEMAYFLSVIDLPSGEKVMAYEKDDTSRNILITPDCIYGVPPPNYK